MTEFLLPTEQPAHVAAVALQTPALAPMLDFYRRAAGLEPLAVDGGEARLGAGGRVLLTLTEDKRLRPNDPRAPGLFHTAFLLPTRADLARWLAFAGQAGLPLAGAADHAVSEAFYLEDPDGNGVEIYADKPVAAWPRDAEGLYALVNAPVDVPSLAKTIAGAPGGAAWRAPDGTVIGHAHLQVGALAPALAFYQPLGFDRVARTRGAEFLGAGGYHHHLAANIWRTEGAERRPEGLAGLRALTLARRGAAGREMLVDPFGLTVEIAPAQAA